VFGELIKNIHERMKAKVRPKSNPILQKAPKTPES